MGRVLRRIVFEFGPPLIVAIVLVWYVPPSEKGPVVFSVAFFSASSFWGQLLRIWYQEDQRSRFDEFGSDIRFIKSAVEFLKRTVGKAPIKRQVPVKPSARAASKSVQTLIGHNDYAVIPHWVGAGQIGWELENGTKSTHSILICP
jgi:hypothetical protein